MLGVSDDGGANDLEEFQARIRVVWRVERGQWRGGRVDAPVVRVHGVGDYSAEPLGDGVHIREHVVVGVVHGDGVAAHRLPDVAAHRRRG